MKTRNNQSFTLIELLLGLSIFSVIALCLYSTFSAGLQLNQRSQRDNKIYQQAGFSLNLISKELENMVSYDFANSYPDKNPFIGEEKKIAFLLPTEEGLKAVSYYLMTPAGEDIYTTIIGQTYSKNVSIVTRYEETSPGEHYLIREEKNFADYLANSDASVIKEVIATNVKEDSLKFLYGYLENEESENYVWKNYWSFGYIPSSIHVEIEFSSSGKKIISIPFFRDVLVPTGFWGLEESS